MIGRWLFAFGLVVGGALLVIAAFALVVGCTPAEGQAILTGADWACKVEETLSPNLHTTTIVITRVSDAGEDAPNGVQ